jgi:hypothetical protein
MREVDVVGTGALVAAVLLLSGAARWSRADERAGVAFFYGPHPPPRTLCAYRSAVVEPSAVDAAELAALRSCGLVVYAYLSVGEQRSSEGGAALPAEIVLGRNEGWNTVIVDPASEEWREQLALRARFLRGAGYDGLFLDTLDSFRRVLTEPAAVEARWHALAGLIRDLHEGDPALRFLLNRGFELLPAVGSLVDGVAAESLFRSWDPSNKRYVEVSAADRAWLAARLGEARDRFGLEAIAIDYVPAGDRALARRTGRAIAALGFTPYVAQPALDRPGVGPRDLRRRSRQGR